MEGLSVETLDLLQKTAVKASGADEKVQILEPVQEPDGRYLIVTEDGSYQFVSAEAPLRDHTLASVDQVGPLVSHLTGKSYKPVVWYREEAVVIVCDDDKRREQAVLVLHLTPQLETLIGIEKDKTTYSQKEFVRLLRITFAGCRSNDALLNYVREVRFGSSSEGGGSIQHGRESLGSDIQAAALNPDECPDEITFSIRVFDDPYLTEDWLIKCAVEILVEEQKFRLTPYPLEIKNAIDLELNAVAMLLAESCKEAPVFRGRP